MAGEVRITNENGKLVGKDENGNTVPISLGDLEPDSVTTGSVDADSATIDTSLTDAAGVSHTGELADDGDAQPPESHGNGAHSETFVSDGDGTTRQIWVIANGASDPAGADPEDIIFEEEA